MRSNWVDGEQHTEPAMGEERGNAPFQNGKYIKCSSPAEIFSIATALTVIFARELNEKQLNTLINLLGLLESGLSAVVTQMQICEGDDVQPPIL